ncbi:Palmitoyltransferase pfa3 [Lecanosticta acicola]|uniref:Palmitoyltransferase n=1 Tax=Lecanosticta acicola TaxID=111012 RepID=A0AAI9EFK6_9PEZI|nr:Palmitoyltransferase pfa3 [Lecanosticta acicola]
MPSTSFSDMPTLASPRTTPSPPFHRRRKGWARKIERCCCTTFAHFPLVFVYGLTTWAVYVEVDVSFMGITAGHAWLRAGFGIVLYTLANISYTVAVFTNPGSPLDPRQDGTSGRRKGGGYEGLPTFEADVDETSVPSECNMTSVTAKSTGRPRYCKKCKTVKPDRTHHCSTCQKCVLKMDHHCPWLATCVGLRNYKAFLLFLTYTSLFCWLCFAVTAWWVWVEILDGTQISQGMRVVNTILLSVLSGIIGLVLTGFTGWHIYLAVTGQTTIESLEKTRYLSPLRKTFEHQFQEGRNYLGQQNESNEDQPLGERLKEIHANALPGVLRPEEGETSLHPSRAHTPVAPPGAANSSPARESLQRSFASIEAQRERNRYNEYLDEQDSEKLPNAFDMGWKRNLQHVFGENMLFWFLPICNTNGDGWQWEVSPKWTEARERIGKEREQREREEAMWDQPTSQPPPRNLKWTPGQGFVDQAWNAPSAYINGRQSPAKPVNGSATMQMQPLDRRKGPPSPAAEGCDTSSDEEGRPGSQRREESRTTNWNDIPDDFLDTRSGSAGRSRSEGRRKGD